MIAAEVLIPARQVIGSGVLKFQVAIEAITSIVTIIPSSSNYSMDWVTLNPEPICGPKMDPAIPGPYLPMHFRTRGQA